MYVRFGGFRTALYDFMSVVNVSVSYQFQKNCSITRANRVNIEWNTSRAIFFLFCHFVPIKNIDRN